MGAGIIVTKEVVLESKYRVNTGRPIRVRISIFTCYFSQHFSQLSLQPALRFLRGSASVAMVLVLVLFGSNPESRLANQVRQAECTRLATTAYLHVVASV